jgi:hypothetical protein
MVEHMAKKIKAPRVRNDQLLALLLAFDSHFKTQAPSRKPQATSSKRQALDKVK